ncbi:conserved hypothetical protein [Frankia sp. AiPs1]|uniref:hypothetical protein n=1 Tax=Frankia sp. AiPa1 TaxID=573492 RepID=UPI00202B9E95|nr:hypothetical protein [Frankia sp. AiPa1]MCL9760651.1 hypothetical protein [Frankia sp. AiPa1]
METHLTDTHLTETRQVLVPPLSGWTRPATLACGPATSRGSDREQEGHGPQEEPLDRLRRCLDRMDALVTLLEADLRRQRDLLASLTASDQAPGRPGGAGRDPQPEGRGGPR